MVGVRKDVQGAGFSFFPILVPQEAILLHVWCSRPTAWEALSNPTLQ